MAGEQDENKIINGLIAVINKMLIVIVVLVLTLILLPVIFYYDNQTDKTKNIIATNDSAKKDAVAYWIAPDINTITDTKQKEQVAYGKELIAHTSKYLGPKGSVMQISNGMNCQNCHLQAGTAVFGNNFGSVASLYPKFRARSGGIENIYKRVNDCLPPITPASGPQEKNYYNPLNLFDYVRRYYLEAGQPQKVYGTNTWIGSTTAYNALANQIVSQGVTRTIGGYPASKQPRGGKNIGVLKTRQSNKYPFTTIFTNGPHRFNSGSKITISGFTAGSPYAVLNGTFLAAAFPAFPMVKLPGASWVKEGSSEYYVNILYDSSKILVDYNPLLHGVPTLTATHGPLTAESEYRETIAAILDFIITAYDGSNHTHTRIRPYRYNDKLALFETWGESFVFTYLS